MPEKNVQVNTDRGLPYERFLQFGPENLTEAELLAVILRTGTKEDSAVALAEKVLALATYPREGLLGLHDVSVEELMEIRGIGMVKAVKLKCIAELSNRMSRPKPERGSASPERIMWRNILWKSSDTGIPNVCICSVWMPKDS